MKRIGLLVGALLVQACGDDGWEIEGATDEQATVLRCTLTVARDYGSTFDKRIAVVAFACMHGQELDSMMPWGYLVASHNDGSIAIGTRELVQILVDLEAHPLVLQRVSEECSPP